MLCRAEPGTVPRMFSTQRPLTPIEKVSRSSPVPKSSKPQSSAAGGSSGGHKPSPAHLTSSADIFAAAEELGVGGIAGIVPCTV